MSITLPTYRRREVALLGRRARVLAVIFTTLRKELRRPAALFAFGLGFSVTTITSIFTVLFATFLLQGQPLDLRFFYNSASNGANLFAVMLMASAIGSGLIADDRDSMALTLYLSRPITQVDYLIAKAAVLAPLLMMVTIVPLVLTPLLALLLGLFPWDVALPAMGVGVAVGLLFTSFYVATTLFLSSLTRKKGYAAAGVFAITLGLTLPAEILAGSGSLNNPNLLYLSPWEDYLAVARGAYGVSGPVDWPIALAILLGAIVLAALVTYLRMKAVEVVSG
jgi:ABC-type transport system involved in multi-copper enzyme maturation permease subunit